ncbi:MAG: hypothetical protein OXF61_16190 [Acidimicrobiaceae bacterium]|nr:hypothetical protein [Acidimicrobiaceae bacterium]
MSANICEYIDLKRSDLSYDQGKKQYREPHKHSDSVSLGPRQPEYSETHPTSYRISCGMPYIINDKKVGRQWSESEPRNLTEEVTLHRVLVEPLKNFVATMNYFSTALALPGYGTIDWIGHLGTFRDINRNTLDSFHWARAAIDITHVHWTGGTIARHWKDAKLEIHDADDNWRRAEHRRLLAIEAGLRKWFGYVLSRGIKNHHNHFHVDVGMVPGQLANDEQQKEHVCGPALRLFRHDTATSKSKPTKSQLATRKYTSCAYFVADCVNAFTDIEVPYDGYFDETDDGDASAFEYLLSELGMECLDPIRYLSHYQLFLNFIIMHGLADKSAGHFRFETATLY